MSTNIQARVPLWEALVEYFNKKRVSFHTPGHKSGQGLDKEFINLMGAEFGRFDLTELPDLDNLHLPQGPILEAQELAALACGAKQSYFLVNGASCGLQAMILTVCNPGDRIIIPRDCHISIHNALIIAGVEPIYIYPEQSSTGLILGITREQLHNTLQNNPEAIGVLLINPNYYGICSDLPALVKEAKSFGKLVLVDEAHGAHLPFNRQLPPSAACAGADIWVQSSHKMASALTQSALLHLANPELDIERLKASLRLVQSTSPSFLLLASLDLARRQLAISGQEIFSNLIKWTTELRQQLEVIPGLKCYGEPDLPENLGFRWDPLKLLVCFRGLSGSHAASILREEYHLECELADQQHILFVFGTGTSKEDLQQLLRATKEICKRASFNQDVCLNKDCDTSMSNQKKDEYLLVQGWQNNRQLITPRKAWFAHSETITSAEIIGRISGQFVTPYPPGIPVICPGEEITSEKAAIIQAITPVLKVIK